MIPQLIGAGQDHARQDGATASEQALRASGADWTIVRSAFMDQNFNESFFLEPVRAGEVAFPADQDLAEPFIDADIADVAVADVRWAGPRVEAPRRFQP
jgi:uncharacterized protein YbjT (DUF2867 family)